MKDQGRSEANTPTVEEPSPSDHFLELMLFRPSHAPSPLHPPQRPEREPGHYSPLLQVAKKAGAKCYLPNPTTTTHVRPDSPAIEVMTDLSRVGAVTTSPFGSIDEANQTMIARGVRALFVVDDNREVLGIITSTDTLGEKPIQLTEQRGIRHDEVIVRDIMTPAERLEVIDLDDVRIARVGDVVATLRLSGRQHALVVEQTPDRATGAQHMVRGIFSLTQIARQLGIAPQPLHDIGRTFAEIEAAIGS